MLAFSSPIASGALSVMGVPHSSILNFKKLGHRQRICLSIDLKFLGANMAISVVIV